MSRGPHGGVGHVAVQLARSRGAALVEEGEPCDLLFDTVGGQALACSAGEAGRIVTIAAEAPGAHHFVVEPNHEQLLELARLVDIGDLWPEIDSVFPLAQTQAAVAQRSPGQTWQGRPWRHRVARAQDDGLGRAARRRDPRSPQ